MKTFTRGASAARFVLLFLAASLLPLSVGAQPILSVSPTSVNVQANVGTNAPSQTVQVRNAGNRALKWSVVQVSASWLSVSPMGGTNSGTVTVGFQSSTLAAGPYSGSFIVSANTGATQAVTVNLTVTAGTQPPPPPPPLTVTCPANISVASPNGSSVVVSYTIPTPSGGTPPYTTIGSPLSGSSFPVGTPTTVQVTATDSSQPQKTASCSFTVTVTSSPPPSSGDISVSPTTTAPGSSVTVSYSIANPTSSDWIGLSPAGAQTLLDWKYAGSCTQTPGASQASGSCPFTAPSTAGTYEFRLFGNNPFTLLDTVTLTVTTSAPPPPPPLTVTCPANISVASPNGSSVVVSYTIPTPSGGTPPYTTIGSPPSGSSFPVGTPTTVQVTATDSSQPQKTASCSFTVTVTSSPPPPSPSGVGPQSIITCPADAVYIVPGSSIPYIQSLVDGYPGTTTFCFRVGTHYVDRPIVPKTGNTFVGEYGAILDGTGWTTTDDTLGGFQAHNQDIDYVTIRNLVIRNLRRGIHAFGESLPDHWTIEYNELTSNYSAMVFPAYSTVKNNYIHHNPYSGYMGALSHYSTLENNEIAYNGWEGKVGQSINVIIRNNFFHHNYGAGIWYDYDNVGGLAEGNRVEDNGWIGIFYEASSGGIIRNNTMRRNGDAGAFLGTSKNTQIYNNTIENNFRGITYFLNCGSVGQGTIFFDLTNNTAHDNTITVDTQSGAFASVFSYAGDCPAWMVAPYLNGSMNNTFSHNTYHVPSPTTGQYWIWGVLKNWFEWRAIPQDATSTVSQ